MEIHIVNWSKYHHRKDLKTMAWFRVNSDIPFEPKLFKLSVETKWLWICLLAFAAQKNTPTIDFDENYISFHSGVNDISKHVEILEKIGLVTNSSRIRTNSCSTLHNITKQNTIDHFRKNDRAFDFELLYKKYPRKIGKKVGMARCKSKIKTQKDFQLLSKAIDHYSEFCKDVDPKFIKHFSTFMNSWEDFIEMPDKPKPKPMRG